MTKCRRKQTYTILEADRHLSFPTHVKLLKLMSLQVTSFVCQKEIRHWRVTFPIEGNVSSRFNSKQWLQKIVHLHIPSRSYANFLFCLESVHLRIQETKNFLAFPYFMVFSNMYLNLTNSPEERHVLLVPFLVQSQVFSVSSCPIYCLVFVVEDHLTKSINHETSDRWRSKGCVLETG